MSEAEDKALQVAFEQGRAGKPRRWIHNLGAAFDARMHREYNRGKSEKVRAALAAMGFKPQERANTGGASPAVEPATWLEHVQAAEAEGGAEQRGGAELARRDAEAEGWTRETAQRYLATVTPTATPGFAKGYDDAVRWFAEVSCGRSPSPEGPR